MSAPSQAGAAWLANDGTGRVIDAKAKAVGERSAATGRATAIYTTPLYATPPAAVPVEALEGLVADLRNEAGDWANGDVRAAYGRIVDRLTTLIKERSNG